MESEPLLTEPTGEPRIDGALRGLVNPDRDVRQAAALDLGTIAAPATAQTLVARLGLEQDFFVRDTLSWALTRIPDAATPLLLDALDETDTASRVQVLHVLSKIADPATTEAIVALTADTDSAVASKARWALTRIGDPTVVPALAAHLGLGDSTNQNDLTRDLASFGTAAVPILVTALTSDKAPVRRHAAEVLCFMGPEAETATGALAQALQDAADDVRLCAAMALYEVDTPETRETLSHHTEADDPRVRGIARRSQTKTASTR
ncbi:HEAT repeat domain-containing protein [Arthrobacter echini]|uniref:HEAT repeat domain-containing protein n=1 Tax=Arthrobacter echini TaxID=1529066 RepID=A0A5D0XJ84_9MICC|nr:HEAT repeat domain-containing protein [Arthrobacter echini]TYC96625.1 HEAT repeat domain-containing protein [Arthrobacter echini]